MQGVIIVGQSEEENVAQELDEYVVTRELQKHFAEFFSAYKKGIVGNTPKMGVWISGFFGSGKSHFLKILSYLLANKSVGGRKAIDYFTDDSLTGGKPKIEDQMVLEDMKLAAGVDTDVVLFNIDSKSSSNGKQNKDAIVNVFLKVFNEMQGFCGAMPFLADLERKLAEEGLYGGFKQKFKELYGEAWEDSRQDFDFIQDDVVQVLAEMDFMSEAAARNWCEKAAEPYQISIEDFARRVKTYIERKGNNHHIVFLVDEIGQYIGEDSKLMLNLQTVTEELGKECMGKAWVIVTSQQDIDSVIDILYTALNTNKETIRIAGQDKPSMVVISKLMKLHHETIMYAIERYHKQTERIKNPTSYMLTILYSAPEQFNLDIQNQVSHDMAHWNDKK